MCEAIIIFGRKVTSTVKGMLPVHYMLTNKEKKLLCCASGQSLQDISDVTSAFEKSYYSESEIQKVNLRLLLTSL